MDWILEAEQRIKRKNQILFSKDSEFLQDLIALIKEQNHPTLILWVFELAADTVKILLKRYPKEQCLQEVVAVANDWAAGKVKMPAAKHVILQCHAFGKELDSKEDIALCHAVGQACSVVHTTSHAIGYPIYDLTALILHYGIEHCKEPVERRKQEYMDRILFWRENYKNYSGEWANFILDL